MKTGNFDMNTFFNRITLLMLIGIIIIFKMGEYRKEIAYARFEVAVEKRIAVMRDSIDFFKDGYFRSAAANETINRMWIEELNKNEKCKDWYLKQEWKEFRKPNSGKKANKKHNGSDFFSDTADYRPFQFDTSFFQFRIPRIDTIPIDTSLGTWTMKDRKQSTSFFVHDVGQMVLFTNEDTLIVYDSLAAIKQMIKTIESQMKNIEDKSKELQLLERKYNQQKGFFLQTIFVNNKYNSCYN